MIDFKNMDIIGLTGMSGAGKTTACQLFAERGFRVIDCDKEAGAIIARKPCTGAVKARFPQVFADGVIDKRALTKLIFSDKRLLGQYEAIVYPYVIYGIIELITQAGNNRESVLLDAVTLYQSGADDLCGGVIAVVADADICAQRIIGRDGLSRKEALSRLAAQPDKEYFAGKADFLVENNGNLNEFNEKIEKVIREWRKRKETG